MILFKYGSTLCLLIVLLLMLSARNASADIWRKSMEQTPGCGLSGFSYTDQVDDEEGHVHELVCQGCGGLACEWSIHPIVGNTPNDIGDIIDSRVANEQYSGAESTVRDGITWYYTWFYDVGTNSLTSNIWFED